MIKIHKSKTSFCCYFQKYTSITAIRNLWQCRQIGCEPITPFDHLGVIIIMKINFSMSTHLLFKTALLWSWSQNISFLRLYSKAQPPNRKWAHSLANLWSIDMKHDSGAYSHALGWQNDMMFPWQLCPSFLVGPLIAACSYSSFYGLPN